MGSRNPERWDRETWRLKAETVGEMRAQGWRVQAVCGGCRKRWSASLGVIVDAKGAGFSLWNQRTPCREPGCDGQVAFEARPPGVGGYMSLEAKAPGYRPAYPPGPR